MGNDEPDGRIDYALSQAARTIDVVGNDAECTEAVLKAIHYATSALKRMIAQDIPGVHAGSFVLSCINASLLTALLEVPDGPATDPRDT